MEHFEKIYVDFASLVYNVALNYVQNIQDAEEISFIIHFYVCIIVFLVM